MWLCFNSNGTLVEPALQHGNAARAGTTNFQIFAYFEDVNLQLNNFATIKLIKPDLNESSYPLLAMKKVVMKYEKKGAEHSDYFKENGGPNGDGYYPGFLFDFSNFAGTQNVAILLDTPGLWKAVISLYGVNHLISVQGTSTFNVQNGTVNDIGTEITIDELMSAFSSSIASKLDIEDGILVVSSVPTGEDDIFEVGQWILLDDGEHLQLKQKISQTENEQEVVSWETKHDFSDYYNKTEIDGLLAEKSTVSGTYDGDNWKTITIDGTTKNIAGGGSNYEAYESIHSSIFKSNDPTHQTKTYVFDSQNQLPNNITDFNTYFGTNISVGGGGFSIIIGIIIPTETSYWGYDFYICSGGWTGENVTYSNIVKVSRKQFYGTYISDPSSPYILNLYKFVGTQGGNIAANPTAAQRTIDPFEPSALFCNFDKLNANSDGYGLVPPDTTGWSDNKTIATIDDLTNYAQKGTIIVGNTTYAFQNGHITVPLSNFGSSVDGIYFITFGNCQASFVLTDSMVNMSPSYRIRIPCCIPLPNNDARTGLLTMKKEDNNLLIYANTTTGDAISNGYEATLIKTKLM